MKVDDERVSPTRVALIILSQIAFIAGILLRILAIPVSLLGMLLCGIGLVTFTRSGEHMLATFMFPASIVLFLVTILSFFYRQLRSPSALLAAAILLFFTGGIRGWFA